METNVVIKEIGSKYSNGFQSFGMKTDQGTFYFKDKTKEGKPSVAFQQLQQFGFKPGDAVRISYIESGMNTFTNQPFKNLMKFILADQNTPVTHTPEVNQVNFGGRVQSVPPVPPVQSVTPVQRWNAPVNEEIPIVKPDRLMELEMKVQFLEQELKKLKDIVSGHGTLLVDLRGEKAVDLHTSFSDDSPEGMSVAEIERYFDPNMIIK